VISQIINPEKRKLDVPSYIASSASYRRIVRILVSTHKSLSFKKFKFCSFAKCSLRRKFRLFFLWDSAYSVIHIYIYIYIYIYITHIYIYIYIYIYRQFFLYKTVWSLVLECAIYVNIVSIIKQTCGIFSFWGLCTYMRSL